MNNKPRSIYADSSSDPFCLGMCEWTDCRPLPRLAAELQTHLQPTPAPHPCPVQPSSSSSSASSSKQSLLPSEHFQFTSKGNLLELGKGYTPANTSHCTKWALKGFDLWRQATNKHNPEDPVPEDLLTSCNPVLLNIHLSKFAVEARKSNGDVYHTSAALWTIETCKGDNSRLS